MSTDDTTPEQDPADDLRDITVAVPAHRVEQFRRFHERFLAMAAHWDARVGNEDVRGPRGRRCRGRRGHGPRCRRSRPSETAA
jgi:hypothetical protein